MGNAQQDWDRIVTVCTFMAAVVVVVVLVAVAAIIAFPFIMWGR